ncbi:MAG: SDR family oxidoreductase [Cyanobacteria bacterium SZAS LIN-2]|nr:SDR family oxidoreductase [Cyanobacteria bacterium SZAS LIN-2]MBS2008937.1 SDR family oxidoreductase [Cyanobacteria bacterium SZAS TMP-1]
MRVFITGASGFIGTAIIKELIANGHEVLGMVRSDKGAATVEQLGAQAHRATLDDLTRMRSGAEKCDAVIHCAMNHDFSKFAANCAEDKQAILALGEALIGTEKPLLVTSGTGFNLDGRPRTEEDPANAVKPEWPRASEEGAAEVTTKYGVKVIVIRLPQVHDQMKYGLISYSIELAKAKNLVAYIGDGKNRWPAVAVGDAARLYRLALEKGDAGSVYNAVGEEGITAREIAESLSRNMGLPIRSLSGDEATAYFGWMIMFAALDMPCSSAITQERLGWKPTGPSLIYDLDQSKVLKSVRVR